MEHSERLEVYKHDMPMRASTHVDTRPIRICALGGFAVSIRDEPLSFRAKPQRKPMNLLKAAVAFGGTEVSSLELVNLLWPDAEGDAARNAFNVALFRLRKLLKTNDALLLREGRLSLDPDVFYVDVWEFERVLCRLEAAVRECGPDLERLARRMFELYRGPFCGSESEPWMLPVRERLRTKFQRHAVMAGRALEEVEAWDEAGDIYERALELDPLAEQFYRRLIVCRKEYGRIAEALAVYRRCRDILSITLGVPPAFETQAIYRSLIGR